MDSGLAALRRPGMTLLGLNVKVGTPALRESRAGGMQMQARPQSGSHALAAVARSRFGRERPRSRPSKPWAASAPAPAPCSTISVATGQNLDATVRGGRPNSLRTGNLTGDFSGVFRRSGILARNSASFARGRPAARCTPRCDGVPPAATRSGRGPAAGRRRCRPPQSGRDRRGRRRGGGNGWSGAVFWRRRGVRRRRHGRARGVAPGFIAPATLPVHKGVYARLRRAMGREAP